MTEYGLARHVFICRDEEQIVVLDLRADRYWALLAAETAGLSARVAGWPGPAPTPAKAGASAAEAIDSPESATALELLSERGWLAELGPHGKTASPVTLTMPDRELLAAAEPVDAAGRRVAVHLADFLVGCLMARLLLSLRPLEKIVRRVQSRKAARAARRPVLDAVRARQLVAAFLHYRIFLFSSRNECLYDSLALVEYLARNEIFPQWIFGVRTRPFAAHCWIQQDGVIFNDTVGHVAGYTPIMVI